MVLVLHTIENSDEVILSLYYFLHWKAKLLFSRWEIFSMILKSSSKIFVPDQAQILNFGVKIFKNLAFKESLG